MATVISNESVAMHSVDKYNFKIIALGSKEGDDEVKSNLVPAYTKEDNPKARESDIDSSELSTSSKESLIESLMKKTDDMSSNFIKLQMKLEAKEEEYKLGLEKAKEEAFNEGMQAGKAKAIEDGDVDIGDAIKQYASSVKKLENNSQEFKNALDSVKEELVTAALDIAKEVVDVELNVNSAEVAKNLALELIKELQSASRVTLKVNPKDHGVLSEETGSLENVEVVSDSAISQGGVIAISDAGNIDAEISKRFERVKKAVLSE
ncbi:MAG: flagellar assembly protein FliH [Campylobacterota bacterium]|nr:flagellar assembly protein FliH [Campylobacterota bacterium]